MTHDPWCLAAQFAHAKEVTRCILCNKDIATRDLGADRADPIARGGTYSITNLDIPQAL